MGRFKLLPRETRKITAKTRTQMKGWGSKNNTENSVPKGGAHTFLKTRAAVIKYKINLNKSQKLTSRSP